MPNALGNRRLRGALLGTGGISLYHMLAWQQIPEVEIVALANRTRSRAEEMGCQFGISERELALAPLVSRDQAHP